MNKKIALTILICGVAGVVLAGIITINNYINYSEYMAGAELATAVGSYDTTLSSLGRALEIQENLKVLYVLDAVFAAAAIVGAIMFFKFKKQEEK